MFVVFPQARAPHSETASFDMVFTDITPDLVLLSYELGAPIV